MGLECPELAVSQGCILCRSQTGVESHDGSMAGDAGLMLTLGPATMTGSGGIKCILVSTNTMQRI